MQDGNCFQEGVRMFDVLTFFWHFFWHDSLEWIVDTFYKL